MTPETIVWDQIAAYVDGEISLADLERLLIADALSVSRDAGARLAHEMALLSIAEFDNGDLSERQLRDDFLELIRTVRVLYVPDQASAPAATVSTATSAVTSKPSFAGAGTAREAAYA